MLLAMGLCGLAASAVGVAHQVLPRQFSVRQERQIMTWEMTRRWRALPADKIFPATVAYQLPAMDINASQGLTLDASLLGISRQVGCAAGVSAAAARVLSAQHCAALLRATYLDSSGSLVVTVGVVVLPDTSDATAAAHALTASGMGLKLAVRAMPVAGTPAAGFRDRQRQLALVIGSGPYVILSTAGFTDGRRHVPLAPDTYIDQEMRSLAMGVAEQAGELLGTQPPVPRCPGAPGC
jgi:hypothetical protein